MRKQIVASLLMLPLLALVGLVTTSHPASAQAKKDTKKPAAPMLGKAAYYEMYKLALQWAPDVQALTLQSLAVPNQKVTDGKAAAWKAIFVSAAKKESREIVWALDAFGDYRKGINAGQPVRWGGPTTKSKPFSMTEVPIDSDAAQKAAAAVPAGAKWLTTNGGKPLSFYLGSETKYPAPIWLVSWGDNKEGYRQLINGATGLVQKP